MKNIFYYFVFCCTVITVQNFSQVWQQLATPEGGGVTDMVYWDLFGSTIWDGIWVTTTSVDWPTGQWGGVRFSSNNGQSWINISSGYIARTITVGQDGGLYASIWNEPAFTDADGLYRFAPQVGVFGILYQASAGDNIFSIAVKNSPHTIFAGTRNGIIRSTDNGVSFGYSNTGIPDSAWVYDIAIDSSGILAIASSKGVFISTDNGDNWLTTTGIPSQDTVVTLNFINDTSSLGFTNKIISPQQNRYLEAGTNSATIYQSSRETQYTVYAFLFLLGSGELSDMAAIYLYYEYVDRYSSVSPKLVGGKSLSKIQNDSGVYESTDDGITWQQINNGLPPNPPVSALALKVINETSAELYAGLFNDTTGGASVYKLAVTVDVEENSDQIPTEYLLEQNYPNPFNPSTTIQFSIPEQSFVMLEVFNSLGEKVSTLVSEELSAGNYKYEWNAANLPSGIYLYKLQTTSFSESKKTILIK